MSNEHEDNQEEGVAVAVGIFVLIGVMLWALLSALGIVSNPWKEG